MKNEKVYIIYNTKMHTIDNVFSSLSAMVKHLVKLESTEIDYNKSKSETYTIYNYITTYNNYNEKEILSDIRGIWDEKNRNNPSKVELLKFIVRNVED